MMSIISSVLSDGPSCSTAKARAWLKPASVPCSVLGIVSQKPAAGSGRIGRSESAFWAASSATCASQSPTERPSVAAALPAFELFGFRSQFESCRFDHPRPAAGFYRTAYVTCTDSGSRARGRFGDDARLAVQWVSDLRVNG